MSLKHVVLAVAVGCVAISAIYVGIGISGAGETPEQKARWVKVLAVREDCRSAVVEKMGEETADLSWMQMMQNGKDTVGEWNAKRSKTMMETAGNAYFYGKPLEVAKAETLASMKDEGTVAQKYAPILAACIYREADKQ